MASPFFSLIVPSRDRAVLLRQTLPTILAIDFPDCEIIVSDNNSSDDTRAVVESAMARDSRLRYVRADRSLSMCDSFEFGLHAAKGEFIVFGSDDDAFVTQSLRYAATVIERHQSKEVLFGAAAYWHPDVPDLEQRGVLTCCRGSGLVYEIPSKVAIEGWNRFEFPKYTNLFPKILKCVTHRDVFAAAQKVTGKFFVPPYPDASAVCQVVAHVDRYHFLDIPLYVGGISPRGNSGLEFARKRMFDAYFELFDHDLLEGCPYPMRYTHGSHWLATQILFQRHYPEAFAGEIHFDEYFQLVFSELVRFSLRDDVTEEMAQLKAWMHQHYGSDAAFVALQAKAEELRPKTGNENPGALYKVARAVYRKIKAFRRRGYRADGRAANIAEAARMIGKVAAQRFEAAPKEAVRINSVEEMAALAKRAAFG